MKSRETNRASWRHVIRAAVEGLEARRLLSVYALDSLASFNGTNGSGVQAGVVLDAGGNLYGTTDDGGANGNGTVFEIARGSNSINTLASFNGTNGATPIGGVIVDSSGDLFGTTGQGGANNTGTVFEVLRGSNAITTLASFNGVNGSSASSSLTLDSSGDLFGTTFNGGAGGDGTVFEVAHGSGAISTVASFNGTNGSGPQAGIIIDPAGNFFGTTDDGGANNDGAIFEVAAGAGSITTLASFNGTGNGATPAGGVIRDANGNLFGTTGQGGADNAGTVFKLAPNSNSITTLASFNGSNGSASSAGVVLDSNGNLFGTTQHGGDSNGDGTAFEIVRGANAVTTLALFGGSNGSTPAAALALGAGGNLFGTTFRGGANGDGTAFELVPDNSPPTAALSAPNVFAAGAASESVTVVYTDSVAVNASTIGINNLSVTGPAGTLSVTGVSLNPNTNAGTITATYTVAAPGGSWTAGDNGTYTVKLLTGAVADTSGLTASSVQTNFTVNIGGTGPSATITAADVISAAASETITVVYSDAQSAINISTIAASNLTVTAPDASTLAVALMGTSGSGGMVTATYLATPGGGAFSAADDGSYTIALSAGTVKDLAGAAAPGTTGVFSVNLAANSTPPTAGITAPVVIMPSASETITVVYADAATPIDTTTINGSNLAIIAPDGTTLPATLGTVSGPGNTVTAQYIVAPPNGAWTSQNDGVYTVAVRAATVRDLAGNALMPSIGSFTVNLSADSGFQGGGNVTLPFVVQQTVNLPGGEILLVGFEGIGLQTQGVLEELNPDGTLAAGFNSGIAVTTAVNGDAFYAAAVQSDGSIVVAGSGGGSFLVGRYTAAGSLDTTFGASGFATADFGTGDAVANSVAIVPDGAIVLGGSAGEEFAVALFDRTGGIDPSFNRGGAIDSAFPAGGQETIPGSNGALQQILIDGDDKIVAVGANGASTSIVRLNLDGTFDSSFGSNGMVAAVPNLSSQDSDGNFVQMGIAVGAGSSLLVTAEASAGGIGVDRLFPDGSVDSSFGSGGTQVVSFGGGVDDHPGVISADSTTGDFVLIGTTVLNGVNQTAVAAFDPGGTLDPNFGNGGKVMLAAGTGTGGDASQSLATPAAETDAARPRAIHPTAFTLAGAFGGFDTQKRVVVGSRLAASSIVQRLQAFTPVVTLVGTATARKPKSFIIGSTNATVYVTGGMVVIDQIGSQFDLSLTPTRANGAMSVTIRTKDGTLTLADVSATEAVRLTTFNAPTSIIAGAFSMGAAVGTLKLSSITGVVSAGSIANLTAGNVSGSVSCAGALGVAKLGAVTGVIASGTSIRNFSALNVSGGTILAGANLGADGQIGGTGADADSFGPGKIFAMTLGAVSNSFIGAGVNPVDGIFGNNNDSAEPGADQIGALTVKSGLGTGVILEAATFPRTVHLPRPTKPASDPAAFVQLS